ncbi:hypothetical protein, partial [Streptomyces clavuligerus]
SGQHPGAGTATPLGAPRERGRSMSTGMGYYTVDSVLPDVSLPVSPSVDASEAAGQVLDAALDQAQDLLLPALVGLGSLSGALLAGRAALAGTQLLAEAAIRAAGAQRELRRQRVDACRAAECWRQAAFAAAGVNARIETLAVRVRKAELPPGPDGPPVPPPLSPVGMTLGQLWERLAATERRLRSAEAAQARAELERTPLVATGVPGSDRLALRLRERRARALAEYALTTSADAPRDRPPERPVAPSGESAVSFGVELIARLPPDVDPADRLLVEEAVAVAAEEAAAGRAAAAGRHLREAEQFADRAVRAAGRRREAREWAALQLGFLRDAPAGLPPEAANALPTAPPDEIALLERTLDGGEPPDEALRARIGARVGNRTSALRQLYTAQVVRAVLRRTADGSRAAAPARERGRGTAQNAGNPPGTVDWTPPGWGGEHWLRLIPTDSGHARVVTMHRARPAGTETEDDRDRDRRRCAEAPRQLRALERLLDRAEVTMRLTFDPVPVPAPVSVPEASAARAPVAADRARARRGDGPQARALDRPDRPDRPKRSDRPGPEPRR